MKMKITRIELNDSGRYYGNEMGLLVEKKHALNVLASQPSKSNQDDGFEFMAWEGATVFDSFRSSDPDPFNVDGRKYKFDGVWCSHCGQTFGPGNHGFSHCESHIGLIGGE